jgi:hypothetical protein
LITDLQLACAVVESLRWKKFDDLNVIPWDEYLSRDSRVSAERHVESARRPEFRLDVSDRLTLKESC